MSERAYEKFLRFVVQHAHPYKSRHSWQEVIGFLFGKFSNNENDQEYEVYVTDVLPMDSGSSVYVKVGDYSSIYPLLMEKMEQDEFIVGWIHSHPGLGIFLSGTDVNTQSIYQQMDKRSIAIVVDHTQISDSHPGLKGFRISLNERYKYDSVSIKIENTLSFPLIYKNIVSSLSQELKIVHQKYSEKLVLNIDNVMLLLNAPLEWQFGEIIPILLHYKSEDEGFLKIRYKTEIDGAELIRNNRKIMIHTVHEAGILSIFQARSLTQKQSVKDHVIFKIADIKIINNKGKVISPEPVQIKIKLK